MATTKNSAKTAPGKGPAPIPSVTPAKKGMPPAKAEVAMKTKAVAKAVPKAAAAMPVRSPAKKPTGVGLEQRRYYVEVAAYHIAERRGFAPGDPLQDWVQAEAEIDRLLTAGLLGK